MYLPKNYMKKSKQKEFYLNNIINLLFKHILHTTKFVTARRPFNELSSHTEKKGKQ